MYDFLLNSNDYNKLIESLDKVCEKLERIS